MKFSSEIKKFNRDCKISIEIIFFDRWALWVRGSPGNFQGSPVNFRGSPGTSGEVWQTSGDLWIAVKFHSERTSGEVAEKLPGKFGELPGKPGDFPKKDGS